MSLLPLQCLLRMPRLFDFELSCKHKKKLCLDLKVHTMQSRPLPLSCSLVNVSFFILHYHRLLSFLIFASIFLVLSPIRLLSESLLQREISLLTQRLIQLAQESAASSTAVTDVTTLQGIFVSVESSLLMDPDYFFFTPFCFISSLSFPWCSSLLA